MVALAVMKRSTDHFRVIGKDIVSEPDEVVGRMFRAREMSTHKGLEEECSQGNSQQFATTRA